MTDQRIGRGDTFPAVTLSGRAYTRPATTRGLSDGSFVVLDIFPPKGFDVEAEIATLEAAIAPVPVKRSTKPVSSDEPANP